MAIRPAMLYGSECWAIKKDHVRRMEATKMRMLQWACGGTLWDMTPNSVIRMSLGRCLREPSVPEVSPHSNRQTEGSSYRLIRYKPLTDVKCEFIDLPGPIQVPVCSQIWIDDVRNRKIDEYKCGGTLSFEQQTELAWGLELSQQRFMWVDSRRGFVVSSWAPQVAILAHPSTGGVLSHCVSVSFSRLLGADELNLSYKCNVLAEMNTTHTFLCNFSILFTSQHCGWNSALESIVHGVSMVAWPLYAEQKMNATSLAEVMGVRVRRK
ncbi:hypothetical protein F3Y22_tig00110156pilonHSYRG00312 [Hibiscus syriacus]|uniref:Uncharacterized protein n=1 Tax=Hibiscus syriacus TaxID=106335 RepID=A0A6A3BHB6_HIBSY|nr:hypothetical protein F3Y22_tig00110156pilonHSYRG00312 [Hibiscus syriacus]